MADPEFSGIQWGGDTVRISASIQSVGVECIPVTTASADGTQNSSARNVMQIAATAQVQYAIHDPNWLAKTPSYLLPVQGTVAFEAVSKSGVVLGTASERFRIIKGGTTGTVSARITDIEPEVARRIDVVRARWLYGQ